MTSCIRFSQTLTLQRHERPMNSLGTDDEATLSATWPMCVAIAHVMFRNVCHKTAPLRKQAPLLEVVFYSGTLDLTDEAVAGHRFLLGMTSGTSATNTNWKY